MLKKIETKVRQIENLIKDPDCYETLSNHELEIVYDILVAVQRFISPYKERT